ncbi:MAG: hypothetical protein EOM59_20825 [Clostridia bacterium]|nr:hypothetical protein [Clostridia bacterium]
MFEDTAKALQKMPEGAEKSQLAFELFGKAGLELMPMLNGAEGSIDEMKKRAEELGLVLSDESIDAGVQFTDTMDQLKRSLGAVATNVGAELMPMFIKLADWVMDNMPAIREVVKKVFKVIGTAVGYVIELFKTLYPALKAIYDFISPYFPLIAKIVKTAFGTVTTIVEGVVLVFEKVTGAIKKAYDWLTSWNNKDAKDKNVTVTETRRKGKKVDGSNRDGLAYVPYDGYISELHKGERVLTAQENKNGWGGNVNHTGTIRVEGINDSGQLVAVSKLLMNDMARQERRNR